MPVGGADADRLNRVLTVTADRYGAKITNEIKRKDGVVAVFGSKQGIKVVTGGQRAVETLDTAENPNFDFRPYTQNIPTNKADTRKEVKYAWAYLSGTVTVSDVEQAMNAGDFVIHRLMAAELDNANRTIIRKIADALRLASPGGNNPESIPSLIQATNFGAQTGNTGELSRSANSTFWQNQHSNTSPDLSGNAGFKTLTAFMTDKVQKGSSKLDQPDFGLTTGTIFASLAAQNENVRRFPPNVKIAEMGFSNIEVNGAAIIHDPSITTGYLYLINTNNMFIHVLRRSTMKTVGDRPESIPVYTRPFQTPYNSEHSVGVMSVTLALVCNSLQRQGLIRTCT